MKKSIMMGIFTLSLTTCFAQWNNGPGTPASCLYETSGKVNIGGGVCPNYNLVVNTATPGSGGTTVLFGGTTIKGFNSGINATGLELQAIGAAWLQVCANVAGSANDIFEFGTNGANHFIYCTNKNSSTKPLLTIMKNGSTDVRAMTIWPNGNTGLGTSFTNLNNTRLAVSGLIACYEIKVIASSASWPDYVFSKDFKRMNLYEVENYISENKHLPQLPSAAEMEKNGNSLGKTQAQILQAVEELYLHVIDLKKDNDALKIENELLKKRISKLEK
jgi:hypothetical protein